MSYLHDSKAINIDTSLKDLLANAPVEPVGSRVDIFVGHNILFITASDFVNVPTGTGVPPVRSASALTDAQSSSSQLSRVASSGIINLDTTLRTLLDNNAAGTRETGDHWVLYIHHQYMLLHIPDYSGAPLGLKTASSIAKDIHG